MKLDEFKAWFEGFTENMDRPPNAKQWARIKERVAEIDGMAITYPVYVERYYPSYWPLYSPAYASGGTVSPTKTGACQTFSSHAAMYAAGQAEALTVQ